MTEGTAAVNTRVNLPSYRSFEIIGADVDEIAAKWKKWKRGLNYYIESIAIDKVAEKSRLKNMVLYLIGEDAADIYATLTDTGDDYESVLTTLDSYFIPPCNVSYERHVFNSCKQEKGENMDAYVMRLRILAKTCNFETGVDERIRDQVVQGCFSNALRKTFLKTDKLDLAIILKKAKAAEMADGQLRGMQGEQQACAIHDGSVYAVKKYNKCLSQGQGRGKQGQQGQKSQYSGSSNSKGNSFNNNKFNINKGQVSNNAKTWKCFRCNREGHLAKSESCPARDKICKACKGVGHFAICCRTKPKISNVRTSDQLQSINVKSVDSSSSSEEDVWHINSIGKLNETEVLIGETPTKFVIDSGAGVNIVDSHSFDQLSRKEDLSLRKTSMKLFTYGSDTALKLRGMTKCNITHRQKSVSADIYVVKSEYSGCLLGKETSEELGILKLEQVQNISNKKTVKSYKWTRDTISKKYPNIVKGVGRLKGMQVSIRIDETVRPIKQPYRRVPYHLTNKLRDKLKEFKDMDLIEDVDPGHVTWISPMVVVPKPTGDVRVCIDMRLANTAIIRDNYPIPTLEELCQDMHGSVIFSKLDLKMGYHQLELDEKSRNITTFIHSDGLSRWKVLIMGANTASEIYQYTLETKVFVGIHRLRVISDDSIIYGRNQEEHDEILEKSLNRVNENGLTLNFPKCDFNLEEIEFYGVILSAEGMRPDPEKVKAVETLGIPKNKGELRSILGLTTYFSRFIKDYATIVEPLRELLRGKEVWVWTDRQTSALNEVKKRLVSAKVTAYWRPDADTRLTTDASPVGLGAILEQKQSDGTFKPIAYASRALSDVERVYCQTEKEGLGIVWACEKFRLYLIGTKFDLLTDHKPLERMFSPNHKVSARIERWTLRLQEFKFTIKHIPGKTNPTDILSRMPLQNLIEKSRLRTEEYINQILRFSLPEAIKLEDVQEHSEKDSELGLIKLALSSDNWANKEIEAYKKVKDELTWVKGILLRQSRIVMPRDLRNRCLELVHKNHMGIVKCKEHLRSKVWWPAIDKQIEQYIRNCKACQLVSKDGKPEPLNISSLPDRPWQIVHTDVCGPFPNGDSLFTMMDGYSRFPEVIIVKSTTSKTLIRFMDRIFSRLGFPEKLVSDNGSNFTSDEMKEYLKSCGIKHRKVVPYSPQSNGLIERFHRTIKKMIQTVHSEGRVWQDALHSFLLEYRSTPHASTNRTPALLMFGREIRTEIPIIHDDLNDQEVRESDMKSKQNIKKYFDQNNKAQESLLKEGDVVLLKQRKRNKLSTRFENQKYTVLSKKGNAVTIQGEDGGKKVRNTRELKLYNERRGENECRKDNSNSSKASMDELDEFEIEEEEEEDENENQEEGQESGVEEDELEIEEEEEDENEDHEVGAQEEAGVRVEPGVENAGAGIAVDQRPVRSKKKPSYLGDYILT